MGTAHGSSIEKDERTKNLNTTYIIPLEYYIVVANESRVGKCMYVILGTEI
jgi:hypothetical protein